MNKNILSAFTKFICTLFIIATVIMIFFVYKNVNNNVAIKLGMFYLYLTFFMLIYIPLITIFSLRKLKWMQIKGRFLKFFALFILFGVSNLILDYIFRKSNVNLPREFSTAFGLAFGIVFIDIIFFKRSAE